MSDILFDCQFNNQKCSLDEFIWKFDRYYGNCFVFNSGFNSSGHKVEIKRSILESSAYGFQMQFYVGFNENLTLFQSQFGKGGYIKIENASSSPLDDTLDGIYLAPGFFPSIVVYRSFSYSLPKPFSMCDIPNEDPYEPPQSLNSDLFKLIYHSPYDYKQDLCFNQCKSFGLYYKYLTFLKKIEFVKRFAKKNH